MSMPITEADMKKARDQALMMIETRRTLEERGYYVETLDNATLRIAHGRHKVLFWPYTGWHSGKSINDGRGLDHLLEQLAWEPSA